MRNVSLEAGKYIIAVSGGIDSVVLLDVLQRLPGIELIVAHIDHGIRTDSFKDIGLVRQLADQHELPFETISLQLGSRTSEDKARKERYVWLETIRAKYGADAILTAHHQDDVIETILINIVRGTGWRGLASLRETHRLRRPLLNVPKIDIVSYAMEHNLSWHEDSTNDDVRYLRNYIRHGIIPQLNVDMRAELLGLYRAQVRLRTEIEAEAAELALRTTDDIGMSRYWLIMVPDGVARELLRRKYGSLTRSQSARLLHFVRCGRTGAILELSIGQTFRVTARQLISLEA